MPALAIAQDANDKLLRYNYPGNVRELKAIIDLAAVLCDGKEIKATDIMFNTVGVSNNFIAQEKSLRAYTCDIIGYYLKKYYSRRSSLQACRRRRAAVRQPAGVQSGDNARLQTSLFSGSACPPATHSRSSKT